jgi:hypothetical protein
LLWVPPCRPWYRLADPSSAATLDGFTKTLVFSSWNLVPKAISTMVSYAAEREMMRADGGTPENTAKARERFSPLLRFARDSGSTLIALVYPSFALARLGTEAQRATGVGLRPLEDVLLVGHEFESRSTASRLQLLTERMSRGTGRHQLCWTSWKTNRRHWAG